ncbi:discoidin domain-containing protein [Zhongshania sp.]|uniref:discoidin domain-containing protein n=1 Tax=Zhongshania sp. TaxID=1971902 RepID=UPI003567959F
MIITAAPNIILSPGVFGNNSYPVILYENIFRNGTVTVSSEQATGEKENAYELGNTNDFWKPTGTSDQWMRVKLGSPVNVNAVGIAAHNLFNVGGGIRVEYTEDNGSTWLPLTGILNSTSRRPQMMVFGTLAVDDIRVLFTGHTADITVGVLALGELLAFPRGVGPGYRSPLDNQDVSVVSAVSTTGALLGTSEISRMSQLNAEINLLERDFMVNKYRAFQESAVHYPFFWSANEVDSFEVFYGKSYNRPTSVWSTTVHQKAEIRARGFY